VFLHNVKNQTVTEKTISDSKRIVKESTYGKIKKLPIIRNVYVIINFSRDYIDFMGEFISNIIVLKAYSNLKKKKKKNTKKNIKKK